MTRSRNDSGSRTVHSSVIIPRNLQARKVLSEPYQKGQQHRRLQRQPDGAGQPRAEVTPEEHARTHSGEGGQHREAGDRPAEPRRTRSLGLGSAGKIGGIGVVEGAAKADREAEQQEQRQPERLANDVPQLAL